jgi:hypothetical protein
MNPIIHQRENNSPEPLRFEFYFQEVDTSVLVQTVNDQVVIRATEDSFSERKRERFVHELALEGFIDDHFCNFQFGDRGVLWTVDRSWLKLDHTRITRTSQLAGVIGACCGLLLLFVLAMSGVYMTAFHSSPANNNAALQMTSWFNR